MIPITTEIEVNRAKIEGPARREFNAYVRDALVRLAQEWKRRRIDVHFGLIARAHFEKYRPPFFKRPATLVKTGNLRDYIKSQAINTAGTVGFSRKNSTARVRWSFRLGRPKLTEAQIKKKAVQILMKQGVPRAAAWSLVNHEAKRGVEALAQARHTVGYGPALRVKFERAIFEMNEYDKKWMTQWLRAEILRFLSGHGRREKLRVITGAENIKFIA